MVKLFGWEGRMNASIEQKRRDELKAIWKLKMFNLANRILRSVSRIKNLGCAQQPHI